MSIHHMTNTRLFNVWQNIKRRCYTKTNPSYKYYGACGIKVCKEWRENFISFYTWAMANGYDENAPKGVCTLDRININGDYEPNNCRWVSMKMQNLNRKANRIIEYRNESHTLVEWSEKLNINYSTLLYRFRRGWSVEKAFNTEVKKMQNEIEQMAKAICHAPTCEIRKNCGTCYKYCKAYIYAFRAVNAGYRKSTDVAEEIFAEIEKYISPYRYPIIAELKKKYIAKDTNVTTKESEDTE